MTKSRYVLSQIITAIIIIGAFLLIFSLSNQFLAKRNVLNLIVLITILIICLAASFLGCGSYTISIAKGDLHTFEKYPTMIGGVFLIFIGLASFCTATIACHFNNILGTILAFFVVALAVGINVTHEHIVNQCWEIDIPETQVNIIAALGFLLTYGTINLMIWL